MTKEQFTFFWSGPFSQWHPSPMKIDGIKYTCAEQYMMYQKALFFGDMKTAEKIMLTNNPSEQKMYGRMITPFDADQWNKISKDIVYRGTVEKFKQNPLLLAELLKTAGTTLVEASPYDCIWGIGLKESDPKAKDRTQWRGTNWLGEILTKVRDELLLQVE